MVFTHTCTKVSVAWQFFMPWFS